MPEPRITEPGVYEVAAAEYHADRLCAEPCFSRSIGKLLIRRSPRHAWTAHPRLNPAHEPEDSTKFDVGTAAHRLMLGGDEVVAVIRADDYRTNAAKSARDEAILAGKLPILAPKWDLVQAMVEAVRAQLEQHEEARGAFTKGRPEQTLIWREGGIWCKARLDWLPDEGSVFDDFKTTGNAAPDAWGDRVAFETGADLQAALYSRGIRAVLGREPIFRFVVAEVEPPHAMTVCQMTPAALAMADRKLDFALALWRRCLETGVWPGYPGRVCHIDPPPWVERRWLEEEERQQITKTDGKSAHEALLHWQAPHNWKGEAA